ncbi:hypothetical protein XMM379_001681 [Aliiroseovarius sp. xm-m-379]|uniref:hypothetical protein n=1 Tax=Aliiroseovarius TaxID=1658781 RepID=UPI001569BC42|nr:MULTISPECIES: hypothetical protein [Aliiroseovarius]NRP13637.1 hypothetical protein [Aliiroseovarius sp. xm-d-517]NRP24991.1 hypothetical protein [Aliiroseovarius sp. xm-m-379]NRP31488.1 hypothetical protein [Aliiroseovarius sp. xm-m-314]NRP33790.1 hypothetical protein [Aliiroseovarius sp. xm-a-104]NRP41223.1 hypothetical protein [Aliiroseovarius sp. xm-m-339-2]
MRFLIAAVFTVFAAAPALALSCMPYNAVQAFLDAQESPDEYLVVLGTLRFDKADLPQGGLAGQTETQPDNVFPARLEGHSLARRGFVLPFREDITANVQCYGPWCGGLTDGEVYLAFLKRTDAGYLLETNPCGGFAFGDPDPDMLSRVKACMRGSGCDPELPVR